MDPLDRATEMEAEHRDKSLAAQRQRAIETEKPDEVDGIRYCLDCGVDIPAARLYARPEAVRCIDCKTIKEQKDKHYA